MRSRLITINALSDEEIVFLIDLAAPHGTERTVCSINARRKHKDFFYNNHEWTIFNINKDRLSLSLKHRAKLWRATALKFDSARLQMHHLDKRSSDMDQIPALGAGHMTPSWPVRLTNSIIAHTLCSGGCARDCCSPPCCLLTWKCNYVIKIEAFVQPRYISYSFIFMYLSVYQFNTQFLSL